MDESAGSDDGDGPVGHRPPSRPDHPADRPPAPGPGINPPSGRNAVAAMLGDGEQVTGGVTGTVPDGTTRFRLNQRAAQSGANVVA